MKTVSLIVPCYNEQEVLPLFYREISVITEKLRGRGFAPELVFVDDGSRDNTCGILKDFAQKDPSVKYLSFSRNFGKEAAMLAGMEYAVHADYIGILDADLQHSPELILDMLHYVDEECYDVAAARREDRAGENPIKSFLSNRFYDVINAISSTKVSDSAQDFRVMKKKVVKAILSLPEKNRFSKGIFEWVGFNVKWIAHKNQERAAGESKWSFRKLVKYALDGILGYTNFPLKLSTFFGVVFYICSLVSFIMAFFFSKMLFVIASVAFVGATVLTCIGILGEYLARVYTETQSRPVYIVSESNIGETEES